MSYLLGKNSQYVFKTFIGTTCAQFIIQLLSADGPIWSLQESFLMFKSNITMQQQGIALDEAIKPHTHVPLCLPLDLIEDDIFVLQFPDSEVITMLFILLCFLMRRLFLKAHRDTVIIFIFASLLMKLLLYLIKIKDYLLTAILIIIILL
ncbi:hypothetical protein ACJX0J_009857, partial [Zea mays]